MEIDNKAQIPQGSKVIVSSVGVMGDKFINITPSKSERFLKNGDYIYGADEVGMDSMFESLDKVMDKVDTLLSHMNNIVGDPVVQKSLVEMSENMKNASEYMNGMMEVMERLAVNNEGNVNDIAAQLNSTLASMNRAMQSVEAMTQNMETFAGDPQTAQDLKNTLSNISATSKNIAHMAENMDGVMGDKQTAEDMKATIHNARSLSERADKMLGKVDGAVSKLSATKVTPSVEALYSGGTDDWNTNFNLNLKNSGTSIDLGVEDIGDGSKLDLTAGKYGNAFGARAGVIAGKPGIGLDTYIGSRVKLTAEAYDPNDATFRLKSQFKIADSTYILGEWHNFTDSDNRAAYFGIKQEF